MNDIALKTQGQPLPGLKLIKTKTFGLPPFENKLLQISEGSIYIYEKQFFFCFCRNLK